MSWLLLRVLLRWRSTSWGTFMALALTSAVYAVCYNAIAGALGEEAREEEAARILLGLVMGHAFAKAIPPLAVFVGERSLQVRTQYPCFTDTNSCAKQLETLSLTLLQRRTTVPTESSSSLAGIWRRVGSCPTTTT